MSLKITERITSRKNPTVAEASKLRLRKEREETGLFPIEGIKLFDEAVTAGAKIKSVFVTEAALEKYGASIEKSGCEKLFLLADEVYEKLTDESAPQGIFAAVEFFTVPKRELSRDPLVLVLDGIADPGNLGTIVRCADALGVECVYIGADGRLYCMYEFKDEFEVHDTPAQILEPYLKNNIPIGVDSMPIRTRYV